MAAPTTHVGNNCQKHQQLDAVVGYVPSCFVAAVSIVTTLQAALHVFVVEFEAPAVRHADDLGVSGESAAVQGACADHHTAAVVFIDSGEFETGCGGEQPLSVLAARHAGTLQDGVGVVVVEGILTGGVGAVQRHALETIDRTRYRHEGDTDDHKVESSNSVDPLH